VRTEFGRTIGGYSHYKWNAGDDYGWVHDEGRQTFLLSFDQAEKYVPQNGGYLILCLPGYGPVFGGGHDLLIVDDCSANSKSYTNFPVTYNREGSNKIAKCQQSRTNFCGVPAGG
jgi:hypothetical protein